MLATNADPPVRFSFDGRWIAFGTAQVVSTAGGTVLRPLAGTGYAGGAWVWLQNRDTLAASTAKGGALVGGPGQRARRVLPDGWGVQGVAADPSGGIVVARSLYPKAKAAGYHQEIWALLGPNLTRNLYLSVPRAAGDVLPWIATTSPDGGSVFYWLDPHYSSSIAADGLPLYVKGAAAGVNGPRLTRAMLPAQDFLTWCGTRLVFTDGGDRYTTDGKRLVVAAPPTPGHERQWRVSGLSLDRTRSWVTPDCSPDGRSVAASAGRNWLESRFGREHRSIWLLQLDRSGRRQLTTPPAGKTDENPRFVASGRVVLFVRSGPPSRNSTAAGGLYGIRLEDRAVVGPITGIGPTGNYYGHYGWDAELDWYA